jgi:hypothetical protein
MKPLTERQTHTIPAPLEARELKARADFPAIASRYMQLQRAGRQYVGRCPFHSERHPSCYIEPERKNWKCFGCQQGGDLFEFVMLAEDCAFSEALWIVADFSSGVARESGLRSGPRFRASVGAAPGPAKQGRQHSQSAHECRARILAALDAAERRRRAIEATNHVASTELATECEPERGDGFPFTCQKPDNCHEADLGVSSGVRDA